MKGGEDVVGVSGEGKFIVEYLGTAMMDSRCHYTPPMIPWIIAEILQFSAIIKVVLIIKDGRLSCNCYKSGRKLFECERLDGAEGFPVTLSPWGATTEGARSRGMAFLVLFPANEIYIHARLFSATTQAQVTEVFSTLEESGKRRGVGGTTLRSSSSPSVSSDSISFEVLYVGKLRMSYRKAPPSFIDDALQKFKSHEEDKTGRRDSILERNIRAPSQESWKGSTDSISRPTIRIDESEESKDEADEGAMVTRGDEAALEGPSGGSKVTAVEEESKISHPLMQRMGAMGARIRNPSGDAYLVKSMSLPVEPMRSRALSTGHMPRAISPNDNTNGIGRSHYNRTMILIVGKSEMKIISPDAKTLLFSKHFREIYQSSQGIENKEYFGFICRESPSENAAPGTPLPSAYVAFVFRCQSESVAADILNVLRQAFVVAQENLKKERLVSSCDHCPMQWYRHLCAQVHGLTSPERIHLVILKYMNGLGDEDRESILCKFQGAESSSITQQNELLMMLLRVHCESKQVNHIHDTTENRHEFLQSYLGGGAILLKAKRSLTNSFDQLIKRKGQQIHPLLHEDSPLVGESSSGVFSSPGHHHHQTQQQNQTTQIESMAVSDSPLENHRPRSSTLGSLSGGNIKLNLKARRTSNAAASSTTPSTPTSPLGPTTTSHDNLKNSHMMNLFQKVGSQSKPSPGGYSGGDEGGSGDRGARRTGSWRHAIFKKVVSPPQSVREPRNPSSSSSGATPTQQKQLFRRKRSGAELRELWKTAINQQIILIRMEKQNIRIKAKQEEADVKRLKLSYKEVGTCDEEANDTWDLIISQTLSAPHKKCDLQLLNSALLRGIPQHKRGQVWQFFIQQKTTNFQQNSSFSHLNLEQSYEELLRQLTSQQHAILIDLGRTFPSHPYFSSALGSGQLALFNILKAYSLLDTDVGYCQGLSFVAGLLLMHLEEEEAFSVLKYIMFDLGAREHYKPDMHELQVKLYQLTRLIHDQDPDVLLLLNHYDVLPSLYAAPWFLTLFASQFSVGFAARVLDVLLLHGVDVIAKFAVVIILDHKKELMECTGLEQVMECFKTQVTNISTPKLDTYLRKVLESDWDKQMLTYAVEYSVMNDEAFHAFLSESSAIPSQNNNNNNHMSTRGGKGHVDRSVQTELLIPPPNPSGGEKHPILGDLIQRQNTEISMLKKDKCELRRDVSQLLHYMVTMQRMALIGSEGKMCVSVPPEVTSIASKYFLADGSTYAKLLETGLETQTQHYNSTTTTSSSSSIPNKLKQAYSSTTEYNRGSNYVHQQRSRVNLDESNYAVPPLDAVSDGGSSDDGGSCPSSADSPIDASATTSKLL